MKHLSTPQQILLIEDNALIRDLYLEIISSAGFQVRAAATVRKGLKLLAQQKFDLILLDLLMAKESGLTFLEKINASQSSNLPHPPIIILTNLVIPHLRHDLLAMGATDYWRKLDLNPKQLIQRIQQIIA